MNPDDYSPIRLNKQFKFNEKQKDTLYRLASELRVMKQKIKYLDEIITRGGYILDILYNVEPSDIDLFYSLKNKTDCKCDEIKQVIKRLHLPLTNSKKVDLGHILPGEINISPINKVVGPFSHHIDIPSMVCLDSEGNIWGNKKSLYCIKNKIHEINYLPWIMHFHFPYSPDNIYYRTFYTSYCRLTIRGLRMIHTKKYKRVGPNFKYHLANWPQVLTVIDKNQEWTMAIKNYIKEKSPNMNSKAFESAINIARVKNKIEIMSHLKNYI